MEDLICRISFGDGVRLEIYRERGGDNTKQSQSSGADESKATVALVPQKRESVEDWVKNAPVEIGRLPQSWEQVVVETERNGNCIVW